MGPSGECPSPGRARKTGGGVRSCLRIYGMKATGIPDPGTDGRGGVGRMAKPPETARKGRNPREDEGVSRSPTGGPTSRGTPVATPTRRLCGHVEDEWLLEQAHVLYSNPRGLPGASSSGTFPTVAGGRYLKGGWLKHRKTDNSPLTLTGRSPPLSPGKPSADEALERLVFGDLTPRSGACQVMLRWSLPGTCPRNREYRWNSSWRGAR
jgi:hypothetical protein